MAKVQNGEEYIAESFNPLSTNVTDVKRIFAIAITVNGKVT